ncbi:glycosyltransferase [Caudoviricetes sp.]|nr:glycosyltransferase [Caudoviricetes sp.]
MKILYLNSEYNGVAYWRMFEPARWLNMSFKDVTVTYFPNENYLYKPISEWERLAKSHDLIVFGRVSTAESLATFCAVREWHGKPICVEMDDDWTCVDPKNISYEAWKPGTSHRAAAHGQLREADMFQVSTLPLKRTMTGIYSNHNAWIAPNLIDIEQMGHLYRATKKIEKEPGKIRVGWAGGANHYGDFLIFLPAMKILADKYPQIEFMFRGMKADYFVSEKDGSFQEGNKIKIQKACPIDLKRITVLDGVDPWKWNQAVAEMDLDIVIVPLTDSQFNRAKSNCRYLELSSLNVPGVYANVYPYANTVTHGENGFLAATTEDWVNYVSQLVESEELRREIAKNAHDTIEEKWSFQNNVGIWKNNYEEMLNHADTTTFRSLLGNEEAECLTQ